MKDGITLLPFSIIIAFSPIDAHRVTAHFTTGGNTITADLRFDDDGDLIDFASDDRAASSPDGNTFTRQRWTTPVRDYAAVGPARVPTKAETRWHPDSGAWTYGEFALTSLAYNMAHRNPADRRTVQPAAVGRDSVPQ